MSALDGFDLERADFEKLLQAIRRIKNASEAQLASTEWLVEIIRSVGLATLPDADRTYGPEADFLNASQQGVGQIPVEFARFLQFTAQYKPASYLEIGAYNGGTASLATAYLLRFNPDLTATTIDLFPAFIFHSEVKELLPLRYEVGQTSFAFRNERFDAVFIDGDHSFEWALADYQNCGRAAKVCGFHDVNNEPYREFPMGGAPAVWELLKRREPDARFEEFFEHPEGEAFMGIGVRIAP